MPSPGASQPVTGDGDLESGLSQLKVKGQRPLGGQGAWLTSLLPLQAPPLPPSLQPEPETPHYQVWSGQREGWGDSG